MTTPTPPPLAAEARLREAELESAAEVYATTHKVPGAMMAFIAGAQWQSSAASSSLLPAVRELVDASHEVLRLHREGASRVGLVAPRIEALSAALSRVRAALPGGSK